MRILTLLILLLQVFTLHAQNTQQILHPGGKYPLVGQWQKLEIGIQLEKTIMEEIQLFLRNKNEGLNPFAEEDIKIVSTFTSESGSTRKMEAFYYQEYRADYARNKWIRESATHPFRVRNAAYEKGTWKVKTVISIRGKQESELDEFTFNVVASESKGRLLLPEKNAPNPFILTTEADGKGFFAIGENITHSNYIDLDVISHERHKKWLRQLADQGANWVRLEYGAQNFLIDWMDINDYSSRLDRAWAMDELVELCMERNLYFILFNHHVEYDAPEVDPHWKDRPTQWKNNSFCKQLNLKSVTETFSSEDAWKYFKRRFRYMFSRYGYAPQFAVWEFSELDNIFGKDSEGKNVYFNNRSTRDTFRKFFIQLKSYIQNDLGFSDKHIAVSFANNPKTNNNNDHIYSVCDLTFIHKYGERKDENFAMRSRLHEEIRQRFRKPCMMEEMGPRDANIYCCSKAQFHHDIWSNAFMGGFGTGMHWWWDRGIHDLSYYEDYRAMVIFFQEEDLAKKEMLPKKLSDKNGNSASARSKRKWECFYLRDKKGEDVLGWINNATSFWGNENTDCMNELRSKKYLSNPCKMEDGAALACPPPCAAYIDYGGKDFKDSYNEVIDLNDLILEIPDLSPGRFFGNKTNYRVEWWSTDKKGGMLSAEVTSTNATGTLKIKVPAMSKTAKHLDYAFKIKKI